MLRTGESVHPLSAAQRPVPVPSPRSVDQPCRHGKPREVGNSERKWKASKASRTARAGRRRAPIGDGTSSGRGGALQHLLLGYTPAMLTQMAKMAVCNRHHSVDQQLCRWLLLSLDRLPTMELMMTQELIARGVRREGVTEAAGQLQNAGLIRYHRGRITVLDRPGLEKRVCECYEVVRNEFRRSRFQSSRYSSKRTLPYRENSFSMYILLMVRDSKVIWTLWKGCLGVATPFPSPRYTLTEKVEKACLSGKAP